MALNNFDPCHAQTAKWEGGWSDHAADRGGKTNWGITQATLSAYLGRPATANEIRNLTKEQAKTIYRKLFWNAVGAESMPMGVDLCCYDWGVNSGPARGRSAYARVASLPITAAEKVKAICASRRSFFRGIIARNASQRVFEKGWMRRVAGIEAVAYKWALIAAGASSAEVNRKMQTESATAGQKSDQKSKQSKTAGGGAVVAGPGGAAVAPTWDWQMIGFIAVVTAVLALVAFMAWRAARAENERKDAFAEAAKGVA